MSNANSQSQIIYIVLESTEGTIPTPTNSDACRVISAYFTPTTALIDRPDKTISLDETVGQRGRSAGSGTIKMSLAGSGAAGTAADCKILLQCLFGKAATISAGISVTNAIDDLSPTCSIFSYRDPSTMEQQVALGTVVTGARIDFGGDVATIEFRTESKWVLSSAAFSVSDATQKGGLSSFPVRPSTPATNGNFAVGFTGAISINSVAYSSIRSGSIDIDFQRTLRKNLFNSYYPGSGQMLRRKIMINLDLDDDDSAALNTLKGLAVSKTSVPISVGIGTLAGNIWTAAAPTVQLPDYTFTDSDPLWGLSLQGCRCKGTGKDSLTLVQT